jgi:hypothetical protein
MNRIPAYHWDDERRGYILDQNVSYYSPRYNKTVYMKRGDFSDGATGAFDINSLGWWVHDQLCNTGKWSDNSECNNWQASTVLSDILSEEGRWVRRVTWWVATWARGGGEARKNGMW